jgi:hypothetical protein
MPAAESPSLDVTIKELEAAEYHPYGHVMGVKKRQYLGLRLTAHHRQEISFESLYINLQVISPALFTKCMVIEHNHTIVYNSVRTPHGTVAHRPLRDLRISPGEWDAVDFPLFADTDAIEASGSLPFELQLLRDGPPLIFPFTVNLLPLVSNEVAGT